MTIASLKKICALVLCDKINAQVDVSSKQLSEIFSLQEDILLLLLPYLHYRWLHRVVKQKPKLKKKVEIFYQSSMRREEDFQRSKTDKSVPLINCTLEYSTFKKSDFPSDLLCLERTSPYSGWYYRQVYPENRNGFDWSYLDECHNTIVDIDEFKENFSIFTMGQLAKLNWNNVFAAGGAVFACIRPVPKKYRSRKYHFFHEVAYETSDVDLFIYGLTPQESKEKVVEIYRSIRDSLGFEVYTNMNQNTITFVRNFPYKCIQVVISNFQNPSEVLANLDFDCVCFGYDGKDVYCLPKARETVNTGVSFINSSLKRVSYRRLDKWQSRGVRFAMPNFITVPFGKKETDVKKLLNILAIAKMNLLHQYNITFDFSNNVRSWDKEYPYGFAKDKKFRGINKNLPLDSYFNIEYERHRSIRDDDPVFYWDSSCGALGTNYCSGEVTIDCVLASEESIKAHWISTQEKWTWAGAPEFRDWSYNSKERVETALLKFISCNIDIAIPKMSPQGYWEKNFSDLLDNEWILHFTMVNTDLNIVLELLNPTFTFCPVIGMFHFKNEEKELYWDITHLFAIFQPKSMGIIVNDYMLSLLYNDFNVMHMHVDIRVMEQDTLF